MGATSTPLTVADYYAVTVEGDRTQLVSGAIVVNDERKLIHAELQGRIYFALRVWTSAAAGRGMVFMPTDVTIDEHNLYAPDILWIAERSLPADLDRYPSRVPEICVEVRSPGTWRYDVGAKKAGYERAGAAELWLVDDRAECVLVYRRSSAESTTFDVAVELAAGDELTSPQLPAFALALDELFDL
jgi:Uma2 family endonuclease